MPDPVVIVNGVTWMSVFPMRDLIRDLRRLHEPALVKGFPAYCNATDTVGIVYALLALVAATKENTYGDCEPSVSSSKSPSQSQWLRVQSENL